MKLFLMFLLLALISSCEKGDKSTWTKIVPSVSDEEPATPSTPDTTDGAGKTMTEEFMELVNDHRESIGLKPLLLDEDMSSIAQEHSQNMATGTVAFGHSGFSERCSAARTALGGGNLCAENVAMGQKTVNAAFTAWMNSPGHKANIEQARATHTGFGFAQNSNGTYYWTQIFLELN